LKNFSFEGTTTIGTVKRPNDIDEPFCVKMGKKEMWVDIFLNETIAVEARRERRKA